jgi:hypothetical protein
LSFVCHLTFSKKIEKAVQQAEIDYWKFLSELGDIVFEEKQSCSTDEGIHIKILNRLVHQPTKLLVLDGVFGCELMVERGDEWKEVEVDSGGGVVPHSC